MSIDMNTHGREIRKAIDEVASDSGNDWCIFGYEGKSYTLKVLCEGDGGVEEMVDEFHGSKIMYGYCKVKEPNTGLPKFVFVNWQGEGAPERMKFACGSHSNEVQRVCRIAHVTINARDDSDVDPSDIISRVVKASGSQHSVLKSSSNVAPVEPVGSVYKKVNPTAEILNRERDAYWQKVEAEDRRAKQEEERRKREEKERIDREVRERDRLEAANRERRTSERNQQISQQRMHERQTQQRLSKQQSEQQIMDDVTSDEQERRQRSASLKNERQAELANLIKQRNATGLEPSQRVGSNYTKVDPKQEIMNSRDQYWMDLEAEEAKRKEAEKRQRAEEAAAFERSRKEREAEDARRRENQERDRAAAIAQQRRAEREQANRDQESKDAQARAIHQEAIADDQERQSRSERLRKERQEEAARLIGQRGGDGSGGSVSNARNFFLQQQQRQSEERPPARPAPGRLPRVGAQAPVHRRDTEPAHQPEPTPVYQPEPTPVYQPEPAPVHQPEPTPVYQPEPTPVYQPEPTPVYQPEPTPVYQPEPTPVYQPEPTPVSQPEPTPVYQPQQPEPESSGWSDEEETPANQYYDATPVAQTELDPLPEAGYGDGLTYRAKYDYEATEDDEISLNPGDIIRNIDQIDEGWWMGDSPSGHRGLFPSNYVEPI